MYHGRTVAATLCMLAVCFSSSLAAGDSAPDQDVMRAAIAKALPLLEKGAAGSADQRQCFTCHNQALPVLTLVEARHRGFAIDEQGLDRQIEHTATHLKRGREAYLEGRGQGGKVATAGYALWTLAAGGRQADDTTSAVADFLLEYQADLPHWRHRGNRPPSQGSDFTATYVALRGLSTFGSDEQQTEIDARTEAVTKWLLDTSAADTEDRVFRLRSLAHVGADEKSLQIAVQELLDDQRDDGGWAQTAEMTSDAYATGSVLAALIESGGQRLDSSAVRRGVQYLLDSQLEDGTWHVVTRAEPFQTYYESGFPHGEDQFISMAGSSWATLALLLALPDDDLTRWFVPQDWQRDTDGPVVELGATGQFDDRHIFAPCVARDQGKYRLWYSGSTDSVTNRVFHLGLATSPDGRTFQKHPDNPVFTFGDGKHSILTPTLCRSADGAVLREEGRLRMWFSSTHFAGGTELHTLHETTSDDGVTWSEPSPPLLEDVYAPTILKEDDTYRMWYVDVAAEPWIIRLATSLDGRDWQVHAHSVLSVDQGWEKSRLFYPAVLKADGVYLMWYGSYWSAERQKTALGLAVSRDGISWHKHPDNPVLRPDPQRPWESHYTTSQSVLRLEDGSFRIWYASRKEPPFVNKYFAINTAKWSGPDAVSGTESDK